MIPLPHRQLNIPYQLRGQRLTLRCHEWGNADNPDVLVCVHGLTRNGRDFDVLADALSERYRVLCPDVPGRGESQWLPRVEDYVIPTYAKILTQMLLHLRLRRYYWLGTSMGGLIGMVKAAMPGNGMRRFICNDVGPEIERAALERIGKYASVRIPTYASFDALFAAVQPAIVPFGPLTLLQQQHLIRTSCAQLPDGQWHFIADPKIGEAFVSALSAPQVDLWPLWNASKVPALIIRGENSDLLSEATVTRMLTRKAAEIYRVAQTGHAPALMDDASIARIGDFLATAP